MADGSFARAAKSADAAPARGPRPDQVVTPGEPLESGLRSRMESRFGWSFADVRVHADPVDAPTAGAVGARAFSAGTQLVFAQGAYAPGTPVGDRLIAHELAHVVQRGRFGVGGGAAVSQPGDAAEREARRIADGGHADVREAPALIARDGPWLAPPPNVVQQNAPPVFGVFEDPAVTTPAGAVAAFDKYLNLSPGDQETARRWSYSTGRLQTALASLGPVTSEDPKYRKAVREILTWIEQTETRKTTGKSDADIAKTQAAVVQPVASAPPGWGGAGSGTTRWGGLLPAAKTSWTDRGNKAITAMIAYAATHAPELGLSTGSFELDFDGVDRTSVGALATTGSAPGMNVKVGFEFVATTEVNPAYALSTVAHELKGHPMYNEPRGAPAKTYAGKLYQDAATQASATKTVDRTGSQTFDYWNSEMYSLLKEIPYWTATSQADAAKNLGIPGNQQNLAQINYDPRSGIRDMLAEIKKNWEPSLVNGIVRGFYKRVAADPSMKRLSVTEFEAQIRAVFPAADATVILK